MPYIIAVVLLVVASVGFTFFQSSKDQAITVSSETVSEEQSIEFPSTTQTTPTAPSSSTSTPIETTTSTKPTPDKPSAGTPATEIPSTPTPKPTPTPAPTPTAVVYDYKNGTYRTSSSFRTPDGQYLMEVGITVSNDTITNTSLTFSKGGGDSYSKRFNNSYQSTVIGRDLGTVRPSRIGGASLTTRAFNSALDTIRSQAAT